MGKVIIKKLQIKTCHGVNDFEKKQPKRFEFSAEIGCDFYEAAQNDEISQTVNYSTVCKLITAVATQNVFNLIETLACRCAEAILDKFPQAEWVRMRVDKPQAPIKAKFKTVSAEVFLKREKVYLSLGSSLGNKKAYLDFAVKELSSTHGITVKKVSSYIESQPYGGVAHNVFLNCAAHISCLLTPRGLLAAIHGVESKLGRVRTVRWEDRPIDIDIIFFGDKVVCGDGLGIPHPLYRGRQFVIAPLKQLCPEFVCPLTHTAVKDM